ncbi:hypothetical protein LT493_00970 [Streptomyces tricolor]|nr:hypothetical protein [Streptomyces tricolor]
MLSVQADPVRLGRTGPRPPRLPPRGWRWPSRSSGTAGLRQDGRGAVLQPGELALLDLRRPFFLEQHRRFRMHLVRVPCAALGAAQGRGGAGDGRAPRTDGGIAGCWSPCCSGSRSSDAPAPARVADRLAGNVADLLASLVDEQTREPGAGPADARRSAVGAGAPVHRRPSAGSELSPGGDRRRAWHLAALTCTFSSRARRRPYAGWIRRRRVEGVRP